MTPGGKLGTAADGARAAGSASGAEDAVSVQRPCVQAVVISAAATATKKTSITTAERWSLAAVFESPVTASRASLAAFVFEFGGAVFVLGITVSVAAGRRSSGQKRGELAGAVSLVCSCRVAIDERARPSRGHACASSVGKHAQNVR